MLKPGEIAPEIDAVTSDGSRFVLSAQANKLATIVFFFPKAFTPGCAIETRRFRENFAEIALLNATIVGVSTDDHDTQCLFAQSMKTPFPMIGDRSKTIARAYGVLWPILERAMRVTFIVDAKKRIVATIHAELNIVQHRDEVLRVLDRLHARAEQEAESARAITEPKHAAVEPIVKNGIEPFELVKHVGSGGMGTVHLAREKKSGRLVALKTLVESADPLRFDRETAVLATLVHPNIVTYLEHGEGDDARKYLAMEWLDGRSLSKLLEHGPLEQREAIRIARDIAFALVAAHANGIIHRDIKPSNVLVTNDGVVKVLDFGIARSDVRNDVVTRTGQIIGTPGYMAPEQARADRTVDTRTDLFALGCLLFRCIDGHRPFAGNDAIAMLESVMTAPTPHLKNVSPALDALMTELLAKEMDARPSSAGEVAKRLDAILATL